MADLTKEIMANGRWSCDLRIPVCGIKTNTEETNRTFLGRFFQEIFSSNENNQLIIDDPKNSRRVWLVEYEWKLEIVIYGPDNRYNPAWIVIHHNLIQIFIEAWEEALRQLTKANHLSIDATYEYSIDNGIGRVPELMEHLYPWQYELIVEKHPDQSAIIQLCNYSSSGNKLCTQFQQEEVENLIKTFKTLNATAKELAISYIKQSYEC